jgi:TetR/AcrR family transcriptional regulator
MASKVTRRKPPASSDQGRGDARERILSTARVLFSEKGFHPTGIREIAARARVNSQLIYYYYGGKSGLRRAVLEVAAGQVHELLQSAMRSRGSASYRLHAFVVAWVRNTLTEAATIRMLFRVAQEGDPDVVAIVRERAGRNVALIRQMLQRGVDTGEFRANLDPRFAAASLAGMVLFLTTSGPVVLPALGLQRDSHIIDALARHTADLFLRGIAAPVGRLPLPVRAGGRVAKARPRSSR